MDKKREIAGYVRLNFQRCLRQGKTIIILIALFFFFQMYLGNVRGVLIKNDEVLGLGEMFLAITNTNYTAFTIWAGFILLICDIPYHEKGIYPYLLRTSKISWFYGQLIYIVAITFFYFAYIFLLLLIMIAPQITIKLEWTKTFFQMINLPTKYGIESWFVFPVSIMRVQSPSILLVECVILNLLAGILNGFLTMFLHMIWKNGPGIAVGVVELGFDYWITVVLLGQDYLLYVSPLSLARIGNISASSNNHMKPGFSYACSFMVCIILISAVFMRKNVKTYEYD